MCAILPIPLLDEHLVRRVRRRMAVELARDAGLGMTALEVRLISGTEPADAMGCFLGAALSVAYKIVKKILRRVFRTVLFWLALKDASEEASLTFHEGYLLRRGLLDLPESLPPPTADAPIRPQLRLLRARVVAVCRATDTRPFQKLVKESLRGSRGALRQAARRVSRALRRQRAASKDHEEGTLEQEATLEREVPASLVDRLTRQIGAHSDYLRALDLRWEERGDAESQEPAASQSSASSEPPPERGA